MPVSRMSIFPTYLWKAESSIDNRRLKNQCYIHRESSSTTINSVSSVGGYQCEDFRDTELDNFIKNNSPASKVNEPLEMDVYTWININPKGSSNYHHNHFEQTLPILWSGIYYVKIPKDSGSIRFYDPRSHMIHRCMDMQYIFGESTPAIEFEPKEGDCYYFPTWLEHDVGMNVSNEDRISIAFNIFVK